MTTIATVSLSVKTPALRNISMDALISKSIKDRIATKTSNLTYNGSRQDSVTENELLTKTKSIFNSLIEDIDKSGSIDISGYSSIDILGSSSLTVDIRPTNIKFTKDYNMKFFLGSINRYIADCRKEGIPEQDCILLKNLSNKLYNIYNRIDSPNSKENLQKILKSMSKEIIFARESPSFIERYQQMLVDLLTKKRTAKIKETKKLKTKRVKGSTRTDTPKEFKAELRRITSVLEAELLKLQELRKKRKPTGGTSIRGADGRFTSTLHIMAIINAALHSVIKTNMAKDSDDPSSDYLRYQSGRFAESAKVTQISPVYSGRSYGLDSSNYLKRPEDKYNQNVSGLYIGFDYMRYPYDTFVPGLGRQGLDSEGRNVRRYIQESIREIAVKLLSKDMMLLIRPE